MLNTLPKPLVGENCNHCGLCCLAEACSIGSYSMGLVDSLGERKLGRCPALVKMKDEYKCGLILNPRKYILNTRLSHTQLRNAFSILLGIGFGCDSSGPDEEDYDSVMKKQNVTDKLFRHYSEKAIQDSLATLLLYIN